MSGVHSMASEFRSQGGRSQTPCAPNLNFCTWAFCLPRWLLRCRTSFSWHLWRSFTATWRLSSLAPTTAFPLPAPHPGCFDGSGLKLSKSPRLKVSQQRLFHVLVFASDFLYLGRFPSFAELERRPNKLQLSVFARLRALIAVCADSTEEFDAVPGRSGPELAAALLHLERFFDLHPELSQSYVQHKPAVFSEDKQVLPKDEYPELIPYRALDASRLKLIGKGEWPMADHLDGPLWLPFQEPRFLLHGERDDSSVWPSFASESRDENLKLAQVWDARGLLRLYKRPYMKNHLCKVLNCYKNVSTDRQIGDRRIPNSRESNWWAFTSPSSWSSSHKFADWAIWGMPGWVYYWLQRLLSPGKGHWWKGKEQFASLCFCWRGFGLHWCLGRSWAWEAKEKGERSCWWWFWDFWMQQLWACCRRRHVVPCFWFSFSRWSFRSWVCAESSWGRFAERWTFEASSQIAGSCTFSAWKVLWGPHHWWLFCNWMWTHWLWPCQHLRCQGFICC